MLFYCLSTKIELIQSQGKEEIKVLLLKHSVACSLSLSLFFRFYISLYTIKKICATINNSLLELFSFFSRVEEIFSRKKDEKIKCLPLVFQFSFHLMVFVYSLFRFLRRKGRIFGFKCKFLIHLDALPN